MIDNSKTCKNCKHWGIWQANECDQYSNTTNYGDSFFDIKVEALDDTGLDVRLITGPEFGCVQFTEKS